MRNQNLRKDVILEREQILWSHTALFWRNNSKQCQNTQDNLTTSHLTDTKHNWVKRRRNEVVFSSNWSDLESFFFFGSIQRSKRTPPIRTRRKVDEISLVLENTSRFWFLPMFQFMKLWILRNLDSSPTVVNTGQINVIQPTQNVKSSMSISQDFLTTIPERLMIYQSNIGMERYYFQKQVKSCIIKGVFCVPGLKCRSHDTVDTFYVKGRSSGKFSALKSLIYGLSLKTLERVFCQAKTTDFRLPHMHFTLVFHPFKKIISKLKSHS